MIKPIVFVAIGIFVAPFVSAWFVGLMEIADALQSVNLLIGQ